MNSVQVKDHTESVRIYFQNNDWRTIPFSDMRGILGLSNEQANAALKTLEREKFIQKVAHGKWRYEPRKAPVAVQANQAPPMNQQPSQPTLVPDVKPAPVRATMMTAQQRQAIFMEAFGALKELSPDGATMDELRVLIGSKTNNKSLQESFRAATKSGYCRAEKTKPPLTKNGGRGYEFRYFYVSDPEGALTYKRPSASPAKLSLVPPMVPVTPPLAKVTNSNAPASLHEAVANLNTAYVEILTNRARDIKSLLLSIEPLAEELRHIENLLKLHGYEI